jgi:L-arabinokinase
MTIAFYISAHGFGHAVRCAQIIRALPPQIPVLIRSAVPRWFFDQEIRGRSFTLEPERFDVGAVGPDSVGIDLERTITEAAEVHRDAMDRIGEEAAFLRDHDVKAVLCDAPAPPLVAAREAGLPALLMANFTWVEIYGTLAAKAREAGEKDLAAEASRLVGDMRRRYAAADAHLIPGLAIDMVSVERRIPIPIVARRAAPDRQKLADVLGFDPDRPIVQIYLGTAGLTDMVWERLQFFTKEQFFSFTPVPGDAGAAIRILPECELGHAEATASVDAVVGKLGYSLCAECLHSGIPVIYPPRPDFAEFPALESAMQSAELAVPRSLPAFLRLEWRGALKRAAQARAAVLENLGDTLPETDGADVAAALLAETWRTGSVEHLG